MLINKYTVVIIIVSIAVTHLNLPPFMPPTFITYHEYMMSVLEDKIFK